MTDSAQYVLDANVFIEAKRRYYGFDFCPGFWEVILSKGPAILVSIDRVKDELLAGDDDLKSWILDKVENTHFAATDTPEVVGYFQQLVRSVQANPQYLERAKAEFAQVTDGWLAAYAKHIGAIVVTHEEYDPNIRKRVKLPNVCRELDVLHINTFEMLRQLEVKLGLVSK